MIENVALITKDIIRTTLIVSLIYLEYACLILTILCVVMSLHVLVVGVGFERIASILSLICILICVYVTHVYASGNLSSVVLIAGVSSTLYICAVVSMTAVLSHYL